VFNDFTMYIEAYLVLRTLCLTYGLIILLA
jgi:hypothetical protein